MKRSVYIMPEKSKGGRISSYSEEFRKEVAEFYLTSSLSLSEVAKYYKLPAKATVWSFLLWYKKSFDLEAIPIQVEKGNNHSNGSSTTELDKDEFLRQAKLKIETLEQLIDMAEEQYNIDIRKKSGSKPSMK